MKSGIQGPDAGRFPFPGWGGLVKGGMAPWRRPRMISSHASVSQVLRIMAVREALDLEEDDRNVQDLCHWRLAQRHCGGLWIRFRKVRLLQRLEDDVAQETVHDVFRSKSMDGTRPQMLTGVIGAMVKRLSRGLVTPQSRVQLSVAP